MKCEEVRNLLPEYMEGTLKGRKLRALEKHLQGCEACQRELEGIREMDARLSVDIPGYWESINPRPEFLVRLRQMDFEASRPQSVSILDALWGFWMRHRTGLVTAVSICIVTIVLVMVVPTFMSPMGQPPQGDGQPAGGASQEGDLYWQTPETTPAPQNEVGERAFSAKGAEPTDTESVTGLQGPGGPQGAQATEQTPRDGLAAEAKALADSAKIEDYTLEKAERAIDIALQDDEVKSLLAGKEIASVEVRKPPGDIEDWTGPVVIMTLSGTEDQQDTQLSVYVDLDKEHVVDTQYSFEVQQRAEAEIHR